MSDQDKTRCGFVSFIGAPNAGKSSLVNRMVGSKVSIVTHKAQTTRNRIIGICMVDDTQVVLVDTPGIFQADRRFEKSMVDAAWQGQSQSDITCLIVDAARKKPGGDTIRIIEHLVKTEQKAILILNKTDIANKDQLLPLTAKLNEYGCFTDTFMISAKTGQGTEDVLNHLATKLPEGPWLYDPDNLTDMPLRLYAAEVTREKLFIKLQQELPYSLTVETEDWERFDNGDIRIHQVIYVLRDTQKSIILGKGGLNIKKIGQMVREELTEALETKVHLKLFVKTRKNWIDDPERYSTWGLEFETLKHTPKE